MSCWDYTKELQEMNSIIAEQFNTKRKTLRDLDLFVLDNSIRETTVGQLRGHTLENKIKIFEETQKCGFQYVIVASFNHMTRVGDKFCQWLVDNDKDRSKMFSFSEVTEEVVGGKLDTEKLPVSLKKCKIFGIPNVILEMDLADANVDWEEKFTVNDLCILLKKRIDWCYENLSPMSKVMFNFRDFSAAMSTPQGATRVLHVVEYLGRLQKRGFGICIEEMGKYLPEEVGAWCAAVRSVMNKCDWKDGKLLAHIHKRWGMATINQLECLMNGANGIWAGVCEEGASVGHASSTVTIMNLIRMGNKKVLTKYNCHYLRQAAINVTEITTGKPPHFRELIYGERALDLWLPGDGTSIKDFDLAGFFNVQAPNRISDVSSTKMIKNHMINHFGDESHFTDGIMERMREVMLNDMSSNRKEEYMSGVGAALLFDRAGGKLTPKMRDVIAQVEVENDHAKKLLDEIREMWDEWDVKEDVSGDNCLYFDSFYHGFMSPYFGCFRCDDVRKGFKALDMDSDGNVDWDEFSVYLKWALRQYPDIKDVDELLSITFRKGLIPSMLDENLKAVGWKDQ